MRGSTVRSQRLEDTGSSWAVQHSRVDAVMQAADSLVRSTEPAVVFDDLVQRSAPLVCEAARVMVYGPGATLHASTWPQETAPAAEQPASLDGPGSQGGPTGPESVVSEVSVPASGDHAAYRAIVSLRFASRDPGHPFIARLLVERAVANVEQARLADTSDRHRGEAEELAIAVGTNRDIGVAMGLVMAEHSLTRDEAFALLSRASQTSNRKLREIAVELIGGR
jgi:hypothetical protein